VLTHVTGVNPVLDARNVTPASPVAAGGPGGPFSAVRTPPTRTVIVGSLPGPALGPEVAAGAATVAAAAPASPPPTTAAPAPRAASAVSPRRTVEIIFSFFLARALARLADDIDRGPRGNQGQLFECLVVQADAAV
jgi:hypothetical protein